MVFSRVLFCDPDSGWTNIQIDQLKEKQLKGEAVDNGKLAQKALSRSNFDVIILDIDTREDTCFEVIKYIKTNNKKTKIILTAETQLRVDKYELSDEIVNKLGVSSVIIKPYDLDSLNSALVEENDRSIKQQEVNEDNNTNKEVSAEDKLFKSIKAKDFFCEVEALYDYFIRIREDKFLKILKRGDLMEKTRLAEYISKGVEKLYFKRSDQITYIDFLNELDAKACKIKSDSVISRVKLAKSITESYIEKTYVADFSDQLYEEGKNICDNYFNLIERTPDLNHLLRENITFENSEITHLFLTALYSSVICAELEWTNKKTRETIMFGSFFHDIGKTALPEKIQNMQIEEMNPEEYKQYQQHPNLGVEVLANKPLITEEVKLVIQQHHELIDGKGFPAQLNGNRIYPPSQVVGFADHIAEKVIKQSCSPLAIMKNMIEQKYEIYQYSPEVIRAFLNVFNDNKPKKKRA